MGGVPVFYPQECWFDEVLVAPESVCKYCLVCLFCIVGSLLSCPLWGYIHLEVVFKWVPSMFQFPRGAFLYDGVPLSLELKHWSVFVLVDLDCPGFFAGAVTTSS